MAESVLTPWTRLARWFAESGKSQAELAEHCGVSPGLVSQWVLGRTKPSFAMLPKIAQGTGLSVDELLAEFSIPTPRKRA